MAHSPLFQVMFVLQNNEQRELTLPGLELQGLGSDTGVAKFDLTLTVTETAEGLVCSWEYATSLFKSATINAFIERFELLLERIASDVSVSLSDINLLTDRKKHNWIYGTILK